VLDVVVISLTSATDKASFTLAQSLRRHQFKTELNLSHRSLKSSLKSIAHRGTLYAIIIGEEELSKQTVMLKNLSSFEQEEVAYEEVVHLLQHLTHQPGHDHDHEGEDHHE